MKKDIFYSVEICQNVVVDYVFKHSMRLCWYHGHGSVRFFCWYMCHEISFITDFLQMTFKCIGPSSTCSHKNWNHLNTILKIFILRSTIFTFLCVPCNTYDTTLWHAGVGITIWIIILTMHCDTGQLWLPKKWMLAAHIICNCVGPVHDHKKRFLIIIYARKRSADYHLW